jgi:N-acetyl-gamma-glutamylphosphate reductase
MSTAIPTVVLGGTGYVAGELLRLIAAHPQLQLAAVMSDSQPGEMVATAFPHLASAYPEERFSSETQVQKLLREARTAALFSAAPHGAAAPLIDRLLTDAEAAGTAARVVDISADFRYRTAESYTAVYKHPHGAPGRLPQFTCALPEHVK